MKLKKFFAGVLAAAMMLTVGATAAFATGPATGETDNGTISFKNGAMSASDDLEFTKTYDVKQGVAPAEDFSFTVKYKSTTKKDTSVTDPNYPSTGKNYTVSFAPTEGNGGLAVGEHTGTFKFKISDLGIDASGTGVYVYEVNENAGSTPGVVYDNNTLTMTVTVAHKTDDKGNIQTGYEYYVVLSRNGQKIRNTDAFTNYYGKNGETDAVHSLTLSKTVHGNFGDLQKPFTFRVRFTKAQGVDANKYAGATVSDTTKVTAGTLNNDKTMKLDTDYTITLTHGQDITFGNLPEGIKYEIYEIGSAWDNGAAKNGEYVVTVTDKTLTGEKEPVYSSAMVAAGDTAAFQNTNQEAPDMGVVLDNAPYIAMLAIVAIGGVALMLNKRRRDEE